jgi:mannose-6-phosphate isomerase-like protein (cupin superfamily)
MERRVFLQFPLVAAAMVSGIDLKPQDRSARGFKVSAGTDHFLKELDVMGGQFNCLVSAKDTGGDLCIYNTFREEKGGPALHMHHYQDEWFYVIKGEFIAKVGDDMLSLKPGDSAFAPRKVAHAFAKINDGSAQMLVLFQPAGSMEDFFLQMSRMGSTIPKDQEKTMRELYRNHGMELVGPPLKI